MKSFIKKYYIIGLILMALGLASVSYVYNKPHLNVKNEEPDFELTSDELFKQFSLDETTANTRYLNKIVQVSGKLAEISGNDQGNTVLVLNTPSAMSSIRCTLSASQSTIIAELGEGMSVSLKGICTGMLMDVILVDCVLTYP